MRLLHLLIASALWGPLRMSARRLPFLVVIAAVLSLAWAGTPSVALAQQAAREPGSGSADAFISALMSGDRGALSRAIADHPARRLDDFLPGGDTPLTLAVRAPSLAMLTLLLERRADPNAPDELGLRPLQVAILAGKVEAARVLLAAGADRFAVGSDGSTPQDWAERFGGEQFVALMAPRPPTPVAVANLHEAIVAADRAAINRLLQSGASVNATDRLGLTALHIAAAQGDVATIEALLRRGATIDAQAQTGETPLMLAVVGGHVPAVQLLLGRGAKAGLRTPAGITTLGLAESTRTTELVAIVAAAVVRQDPAWAAARLVAAAEAGNARTAQILLIAGAAPNGAGPGSPAMPLHAAAFGGHAALVELLLRGGADARAKDAAGNTALLAAMVGARASPQLIGTLFEAAGREDPPNREGFNALDVAAMRTPPHPDLVTLLSTGRSGRPAAEEIRHAVASGNVVDIRRLAATDQNLMAADAGGGRSLVSLAVAQPGVDALAALLAAGASPNGIANEAQPPLLVAAAARNAEAVRRLIAAGADPFARGTGRQTPRDVARQRNDQPIQQALQQAETGRARAVSTALFSLGYLPQPSDQWSASIDEQITQFRRHRRLEGSEDALVQLASAVRTTIRFCNRSAREASVATAAPVPNEAGRFRVYAWINIGAGRCDRMTERVPPGATAYYVVVRGDRPVVPQGQSAGFCVNLRDGHAGMQSPGAPCAAPSTVVPFQAYTFQEGQDPLIVLQ